MADLLYELLVADAPGTIPTTPDADALAYLASLASRPLSALQTDEPQALAQTSHSLQLSLQGLAKKSYRPVLASAQRHATLPTAVPELVACTAELRRAIPSLDDEVVRFSTAYRGGSTSLGGHATTDAKSATSTPDLIARRREALLLARNAERLGDVLRLPPLLASLVSKAPVNYASALDLHGHIRRLHALYPASAIVQSVAVEAEASMRATAAGLVQSLKAPSLKLAAALRTISWLRRVLPDMGVLPDMEATITRDTRAKDTRAKDTAERDLGALFLVCRLATLTTMLDALAPLRDLADQEQARQKTLGAGTTWSGGQQTERYIKRYIEIFREQSFAIVSMYKSIFPGAEDDGNDDDIEDDDPLAPRPSPLATFPLHLVDMLLATLRTYLPTVRDQAARDSLLTQVLYCAGSLGRLGGDFGLFLATLDVGDEAEAEWVEVVRRHRQLAGRLESIVGDPK